MAQDAEARVQHAVAKFLQELDRSGLRKMQGDMHRCAASCCDSTIKTMEEVHQCIQSCSNSMTKAQSYVEKELSNYQNRLERCVLQCKDNAEDKVTSTTTKEELDQYQTQFGQCVSKCADSHIELLPAMFKRMTEVLNRGKYPLEA